MSKANNFNFKTRKSLISDHQKSLDSINWSLRLNLSLIRYKKTNSNRKQTSELFSIKFHRTQKKERQRLRWRTFFNADWFLVITTFYHCHRIIDISSLASFAFGEWKPTFYAFLLALKRKICNLRYRGSENVNIRKFWSVFAGDLLLSRPDACMFSAQQLRQLQLI